MTVPNPTAAQPSPAPQPSPAWQPAPPSSNRPGRWIAVLLIVLGAIGALWAIAGGLVQGFSSHAATSSSATADAAGVEELRIDSSAAAFEIRFADVEEATLDVTTAGGPAQQWRLERSGDALVVDSDRGWRWFGFGIMFGDRVGEEQAVLTLPAALEHDGVDLTATVSAGSLDASADWGTASVDLSAGNVDIGGTADDLTVQVAAGEARLDVADVGTVGIDVSAGRVVGAISGDQPDAIDATVSAGSVELTIPDGEYAVTEDASAGSSDVRVVDDPSATSTIDVEVSAGSVRLSGQD
ncbi:DUF4097 family beta strand repeat-containing protein [Agrococcus carbonis]|uniref:Putative adhesin n=1 Tax=Agrococcus carbonis TaxID=684552 RepID=A0A1H1T773_9MICO|nr:DUF4097 family beta strand repeat-containing protein [Agrococcus carbonis]SDS56100.1 Putative adhesin [Agrococcus carbonis]